MKIAVLIYGHARIMKPFNHHLSTLKKYVKDFDVYAHVWRGNDKSSWAGNSIHSDDKTIEEFIDQYNPVSYEIEDQASFDPTKLRSQLNPHDRIQMMSQLYSISKVCSQVKNPEEYKYFILTRTDVIYTEDCLDIDQVKPGHYYSYKDLVQIFALDGLRMYSNYEDIINNTPPVTRLVDCELVRSECFTRHGIEHHNLGIICYLMRIASDLPDLLNIPHDTAYLDTTTGKYYRLTKGDKKLVWSSEE